jgi:sortase B
LSDNKTNEENEIDNTSADINVNNMIDGVTIDELRKKYDVAELEEIADAPPADEQQAEESYELPVRKKFFGSLKRKNRQSEEEISVPEAGVNAQGADESAVAEKEAVVEKESLPEPEPGTSKSVVADTGFDAFPSFLHISDSDIPSPQFNSNGVELILAELVELESGIPPEIQVLEGDVPELLAENDLAETDSEEIPKQEDETAEIIDTPDDLLESTDTGEMAEGFEEVPKVVEERPGEEEPAEEETPLPLPESSSAVAFLDDIRKIFAASSVEPYTYHEKENAETESFQDDILSPQKQPQSDIEPGSNSAQMPEATTHSFSVPAGADAPNPSLRIVYQAPDGKYPGFSAVNSSYVQPASVVHSPSAEQNPVEKGSSPSVTVTDFLANMRIVYEAPEEIFNEPAPEEKEEKPVPSETSNIAKLPEIEADSNQISDSAEIIHKKPIGLDAEQTERTAPEAALKAENITGSSPAGLADLFDTANEGTNISKSKKSFKQKLRAVFPQKDDGFGEIIRKIVLIISVLTMIVCSVILFDNYVVSPYLNYRQSQQALDVKTNSSLIKDWSSVKDKYSNINFPTGMQLKYAELYSINQDFAGWLEIPGIGINMPIVQGKNNLDYLKKSFYNKQSKFGCCFVDHYNNIKELDRNTVIFGHNTRYGSNAMFVPLEKLRTVEGFKKDPLIEFDTLYANHKWKIYAVFVTNAEKTGDNGYVFNYIFKTLGSDETFNTYIKELDQRKLYSTGVDILPTDKILTLSTCTYDFDDARLVVVARMLRPGESEDVNTSAASVNKSPRYPQAWYSAKGQTDPYINADKWFPS